MPIFLQAFGLFQTFFRQQQCTDWLGNSKVTIRKTMFSSWVQLILQLPFTHTPMAGCNLILSYHQLKYSSPNHSKNNKKQEPHKRAYLSENVKRGQKNGPKAKKDKTERATGHGRRTRDIEKSDQTDSPQISDRGETSESPASLQQYQLKR